MDDEIEVQEDIVCQHCGSVNDYSTTMKSNQKVANCNSCGKYIKNIPYRLPRLYFGKYKNQFVTDITDTDYLKWVLANVRLTGHLKTAIESQVFKLSSNG